MTETKIKRISIKISNTEVSRIEGKCSCTSCDSLSCFRKRQKHSPCSCDKCKGSSTCIFFAPKKISLNESFSGVSNVVPTDSMTQPAKPTVDRFEKIPQQSEKNIICEMETCLPRQDKTKDFMNPTKSVRSEIIKNQFEERHKIKAIQNAIFKHSDNDVDSTRIKLSSQLMNIDLKDLKQYLSHQNCTYRSDTTYKKCLQGSNTSPYKISKVDIFEKIKGIYEACSCKVCECLTTTRSEMCKCKPCDCDDCMRYLQKDHRTVTLSGKIDHICKDHRRASSGTQTKLNKYSTCKCKPCDCIKCTEYTKPCNCEPCQCIECTMLVHRPKTLVVAPVGQETNRILCQCSPCDCIECVNRFGLSSNVTHEISTGTTRHTHCQCEMCNNESCQSDGTTCPCERHNKIVNKPVQQDTHDYDMRQVLFNHNPNIRNDHRHCRQDTIAIYTALSRVNTDFNNKKEIHYDCDQCNCIICNSDEDTDNTIQFVTPRTVNIKIDDICGFRRCECESCGKGNVRKLLENRYTHKTIDDKSAGSVLSSKDCKMYGESIHISQQPQYNISDTRNQRNKIFPDKVFSRQSNCTMDPNHQSCQELYNMYYYHAFPIQESPRQLSMQKISNYESMQENKNDADKNLIYSAATNENIKCDPHLQYKNFYKSYSLDKFSPNYSSECETNSKDSWLTDTANMTPLLKLRDTFQKNCCSSNCHPVHITKCHNSTVETCLNDIITLNEGNKTELDNSKIIPKLNMQKGYLMKPPFSEESMSKTQTTPHKPEEIKTHSRFRKSIDNKNYPQRKTFKQKRSKEKYIKSCSNFKNPNTCNLWDDSLEYIAENVDTSLTASVSTQTVVIVPTYLSSTYLTSSGIYADSMSQYTYNFDTNITQDQSKKTSWNCETSTQYSDSPNDANTLITDEDYENVYKILQDAKNFSLSLQKILQKYEKANRDFESISRKLKLSHHSHILSEDDCSIDRVASKHISKEILQDLSNNVEKDYSLIETGSHINKQKQILKTSCTPEEKDEISENSSTNTLSGKSGRITKITDSCSLTNDDVLAEKSMALNEVSNIYNEFQKSIENTDSFGSIEEISASSLTESDKERIKRALIVSESAAATQTQDLKEKKLWPILKKNFDLTSMSCLEQKDDLVFPAVELEEQTALQTSISLPKNNKVTWQHKVAASKLDLELEESKPVSLKTLGKEASCDQASCVHCPTRDELERQIRELVDAMLPWPILKRLLKSEDRIRDKDIRNSLPVIENGKSSCDNLKACFVCARRVSDHTVLIKWHVPRDESRVQGYELLVDGRAVQKIFSRSKCMAIVTCLPHANDILLTIRTITSLVEQTGHYPAASIIYHPRQK